MADEETQDTEREAPAGQAAPPTPQDDTSAQPEPERKPEEASPSSDMDTRLSTLEKMVKDLMARFEAQAQADAREHGEIEDDAASAGDENDDGDGYVDPSTIRPEDLDFRKPGDNDWR